MIKYHHGLESEEYDYRSKFSNFSNWKEEALNYQGLHRSPLFKDLNGIKLFDEVTVHIAVFMYKFKNQLLPNNFNVFFFSLP